MPDRRFAIAILLVTVHTVTAQQFVAQAQAIRTSTPTVVPAPATGLWSYGAIADFDGNGTTDWTIVCSDSCLTLRRTATGWQSIASPYATQGQRPIAYDFDNDGDSDVLLAPPYLGASRSCRLRRMDGAGISTEVTPQLLNIGSIAAAAIGDYDHDGRADLLVSAVSGASVPGLRLIKNASAPTFNVATLPAGLPYGLWPAFFDIDGDGDDDVLACNATAGWVLIRNDAGVMVDATATLAALPRGHVHLLTGDFDADGRTDCAAVRSTGEIDVLWGNPGGAVLATGIAMLPTTRALAAADLDGDGDLDLIAERSADMAVLWNDGSRSFAVDVAPNTTDATPSVCDLDGDGVVDIVFAIAERRDLLRCLYRGQTEDAAFYRGATLLQSGDGLTTAVDLDRDGRVDLVTAAPGLPLVQRAMGGGSYLRTRSPAAGISPGPTRCDTGDIDGDGDNDLVVRTPTQLHLLAYAGNGIVQPRLSWPILQGGPDGLRVADIDGDGDLDILTADLRGVLLTRNLGAGQFAPPVSTLPFVGAPHCLDVVDVDNDGDLDIVADVIAPSQLTHTVATNGGSGTFTLQAHSYVNLGIAPTHIRSADLGGDGNQDLVVVDGTLRVYRGDGTGVFADRTPFDIPPAIPMTSVVVADLDGDDDPDIAGTNGNGLVLLINDGNGHFIANSNLMPNLPSPVNSLRAFDCDGDGDVDLLCRANDQEQLLLNMERHLRLPVAPRVGALSTIELMTRRPSTTSGLAAVAFAAASETVPSPLLGLRGTFDLDMASLEMIGLVQTSSIGVANAFLAVPASPQLFGATFRLQAAVIYSSAQGGFTNAISETILR